MFRRTIRRRNKRWRNNRWRNNNSERLETFVTVVLLVIAIGGFIYFAGLWNPLKHARNDSEVPSPAPIHLPSATPHPAPNF